MGYQDLGVANAGKLDYSKNDQQQHCECCSQFHQGLALLLAVNPAQHWLPPLKWNSKHQGSSCSKPDGDPKGEPPVFPGGKSVQ